MSLLNWIALAFATAVIVALAAYVWQIDRAYARIAGRSEEYASPLGTIEYIEGGAGPPVLVIHGSGGGFDQGELIAHAVLGDAFRWIAPSRFGYLRSSLPDNASFDTQAHAYAALLDHLGIGKVAVVALSHGGPSALLFAVLYPERVASLVLVSSGVAASSAPDQARANRLGNMLTRIYRHDLLYWGLSTLLRTQLLRLMGASPEVVAGLDPAQRRLAAQVVHYMNPVAPRSAGVTFDNQAALPNERIAAVQAPTLILHATDDTLQRFHNAAYAAATISDARLHRYERGGHLLLVVEQDSIRAETQQFILANQAFATP